MKGSEFIRRLGRLAKAQGVSFEVRAERGKGSHRTLSFGNRTATIPDLRRELKTGTRAAILRELGLSPRELE